MRGVDLNAYDFDFDLTWAALFINANDFTYGRYGARDEGHAESGLSLKGLKYAMAEALKAYKANSDAKPPGKIAADAGLPDRPERYPAASRLKKDSCIHCHQVHNFQSDLFWSKKSWSKDRMWLYPPPKTVGLDLDVNQGDRIKNVTDGSAAAAVGLKKGDVLTTLNGVRMSSPADVQYALNKAPTSGRVPVSWTRDGKPMTAALTLKSGWRKSDISWRASMWTMPPAMGIYGRNLTVEQKKKLGLGEKRLAFRQGNFVPRKTRQAGIRGGDIIIGVDGKPLEMTMLQFNVYMRANYDVGDKVKFDIIRNGKRISVPMTLPVNPR